MKFLSKLTVTDADEDTNRKVDAYFQVHYAPHVGHPLLWTFSSGNIAHLQDGTTAQLCFFFIICTKCDEFVSMMVVPDEIMEADSFLQSLVKFGADTRERR
jgi:hypothetical protein